MRTKAALARISAAVFLAYVAWIIVTSVMAAMGIAVGVGLAWRDHDEVATPSLIAGGFFSAVLGYASYALVGRLALRRLAPPEVFRPTYNAMLVAPLLALAILMGVPGYGALPWSLALTIPFLWIVVTAGLSNSRVSKSKS